MKFSTVLGTVFPYRPKTILPASSPSTDMSKNTFCVMVRSGSARATGVKAVTPSAEAVRKAAIPVERARRESWSEGDGAEDDSASQRTGTTDRTGTGWAVRRCRTVIVGEGLEPASWVDCSILSGESDTVDDDQFNREPDGVSGPSKQDQRRVATLPRVETNLCGYQRQNRNNLNEPDGVYSRQIFFSISFSEHECLNIFQNDRFGASREFYRNPECPRAALYGASGRVPRPSRDILGAKSRISDARYQRQGQQRARA